MYYKRIEMRDGEPVQFLGVYATRWDWQEMGEPTVGFIEVEDPVVEAAPQLLRALENLLPIAVAAIDEAGGDPEQFYVVQQAQESIAAAYLASRAAGE